MVSSPKQIEPAHKRHIREDVDGQLHSDHVDNVYRAEDGICEKARLGNTRSVVLANCMSAKRMMETSTTVFRS